MNLKSQSLHFIKAILLPFLLAGIILFVLFLMVPQPVQAASFVVSNSNDSGSGSLRWAIDQANASSGDDIITFAESTNGNPIYLVGATGDDANASGDLDILDNGNLTILGNGAAITVIDGSGNDRVFHICPGGGCSNTVIMDGVTIRDGSTTSPGGGIWNYGTLNVLNSEINGSSASTGGGIYNESGKLTLDGSMIYKNTSSGNGGGIYAKGTFTIQNYTIVDGNAADLKGGGIFNAAGTTVVDNSIIRDNTAENGGGIFNWEDGILTVQNGSFIGMASSGNSATDNGGGIFNDFGSTTAVYSSTILTNTATFGGGIYNAYGGIFTVDGSFISDNQALNGGGICNYYSLTLQSGSTIGGTNGGNTALNHGGGIFNEGGTVVLDSSTISSNTAGEGGGVFNWDEGTLFVQNSSAIGEIGLGNSATGDGGGIYNFIATATVDGSTVSANTAVNGGGIFNGGSEFYPSTMVITNSSVIGGTGAGNTATKGGGINNNQLGVTTLISSTVSANNATDGGGIYNLSGLTIQGSSTIGGDSGANSATNGGGVYNKDGTTWLDNSAILSNIASTHGGGIYNDASLYIKNESAVSANEAIFNGGGIYHSGTLSITNSTIGGIGAGNIAGQYGGGIYSKQGTATIDSGIISDNTADYGGGIYNGATLKLFNNSLIGGFGAGNIAASEGGGIYNIAGSATITGCRIKYNTATDGGGIFNNNNTTAATNMTGSCFAGNSDTSFFNNVSAWQIATGNWWGSSAGPNSPGADTVSSNVDVSGYLTVPILGCRLYIFLPLIMR